MLSLWSIKSILAISAALFLPENRDDLRIVGGFPTKAGDFQSVVALRIGQQVCTATVVSPDLLVSAAHCFAGASPGSEVTIFQGNSLDNSRTQRVKEWAAHPSFCGRDDCGDESFDYAYVVPTRPIELSTYPRPITSQEEYDLVMQPGATLTLVGFGHDEEKILGVKRQVDTEIAAFRPMGRQFLTAGQGRDSCRGDSGGPAFGKDAQGNLLWLGVLSAGAKECGKGGYYGIPLPCLSWLEQETSYNPGGCLDEDCLSLTRHLDSQDQPVERSGCSMQTPQDARSPWLMLFALLLWIPKRRVLPVKEIGQRTTRP